MRKFFRFIILMVFFVILMYPGYAESNRSSVFNDCRPELINFTSYPDWNQSWYAIPVTSGKGNFNPVYLQFKYTCEGGNPDKKQSLTFPCLLAYKFEFVPDNNSSRHPCFIFKRDSKVLQINASNRQEITNYIQSWSATHVIAGDLIQTEKGYKGNITVFDRQGKVIYTNHYSEPVPYFTLMGMMVRDWMKYRKQPVSDGLYEELTYPMTIYDETIRWFGETFEVPENSQAEWNIYERILRQDPGFGEVEQWYANQQGWKTGNRQEEQFKEGMALLNHPVMAAIREYDAVHSMYQPVVENYRKTLTHLQEIMPGNPDVISADLRMKEGVVTTSNLDNLLPIAQKYPGNYNLLNQLSYEYMMHGQYEKSIPLYLSAVSSGYLTDNGSFDYPWAQLSYQYNMLGLLPDSLRCAENGLQNCTADLKKWLDFYQGEDFHEAFDFKNAALCYKKRAFKDHTYRSVLLGLMSLYEGGFLDECQNWENDPRLQDDLKVIEPFILARKSIVAGRYEEALSELKDIPLPSQPRDKQCQLEAAIVRADAMLMAGDPRACQLAQDAWYLAPRSRRTAYLIEKAFHQDPQFLDRFMQTAYFIFDKQAYWKNLNEKYDVHHSSHQREEQAEFLYKKLLQELGNDTNLNPLDFWLKQPPLTVEYICWQLVSTRREKAIQNGMELYLKYISDIGNLCDNQTAHTRIFWRQLLTLIPLKEQMNWSAKLDRNQDAYYHYKLGQLYQKYHQYDQAISNYCISLLLNPNDPQGYMDLGDVYSKKQQYLNAIDNYERAASHSFGVPNPYQKLGSIYETVTKDYGKAAECYHKLTTISPADPENYYKWGYLEFEQQKYNEAVLAFRQLLKLDTDYPKADYYLECSLKELGQNPLP